MEKANKIPIRLFKYRPFRDQTLDMLVTDRIFFADPSTFNDPLDTKPSLEADIDSKGLELILTKLVEQRESAEMTAAAKTIKYRGPKTIEHIFRQSQRRATSFVDRIRYDAESPMYERDDTFTNLLRSYVEIELLRRYDRGIFSLAERATCPLMWSHYGDQHKGVCIGYSVPFDAISSVHKMEYGGARLVAASKVAAMLQSNEAAHQHVDRSVLLRKAKDWHYEKEWRVIGPRGLQNSDLELEEVIFGLRCDLSVKYAISKALEGRSRAVKFYEIRQAHGTFKLKKYILNSSELAVDLPRRIPPPSEVFGTVSDFKTDR